MDKLRAPAAVFAVVAVLSAPAAWADTRTDARRYFTRGMEALRTGRHRDGIDQLLKAYALRPHPNVLYNVGRAHAALGEIEQAIDYFERYLASDPPDAEKVAEAVEALVVRQRLRALVDEGMTAIAEGRYLHGVELLQKAYTERPHPNLLYNIARAQEQGGDVAGAEANYRRYLGSKPPDAAEVEARLEALAKRKAAPPPGMAPPVATLAPSDGLDLDRIAELIAEKLRARFRGALPAPSPPVAEIDAKAPIVEAEGGPELVDKEEAGYEEVVVTASRREQSPLDAPNAVTIITEEDIRLSGVRSIPDLLRRVPGMDVMAMSYSDFNVAMRGFNRRIANKLLVLVDGRTAYADFLGGTLWRGQSFDLMDIARIEVVRGPGSAIYGAYAYTGIVNIITKRPQEIDGSTVHVAAGSGDVIETTYQYGKRAGPVGARLSVGFEQGDKFDVEFDPKRVDYSTNAEEPALSLRRVRADAEAEYVLAGGRGRLHVGAGIGSGELELYGVSALRNQHIKGSSGNVRGGFDAGPYSLLVYWDALRFDSTPQYYRTGLPDLGSQVRADTVVAEPVYRPTFSLLGEHALVIGGEFRHKFIEWDYLDGPHEESFFAVYAQDAWAVSEDVTVLVSYRLDNHPLIGFVESPLLGFPGSPRVAVIYQPGEGQAIRGTIGTAFRQPTQAETYLSLAASSPVAGVAIALVGGQENLAAEDIITVDVGYLLQTDIGEFEIVAYFNRVNNLITRTPLLKSSVDLGFDPALGAYIGARSFFKNDERIFHALGSEIAATLYPFDGIDIGASYALQYIFDTDSGDRFTDAPMHKATIWAQLRTAIGLDAGLSVHYVSSQDWIEPEFDTDDPSGFRLDPQRVDASVVVNGRLGYRLLDDQLELAVSGTNLIDTGNNRHREHPFANRVEARVLGSVTARF